MIASLRNIAVQENISTLVAFWVPDSFALYSSRAHRSKPRKAAAMRRHCADKPAPGGLEQDLAVKGEELVLAGLRPSEPNPTTGAEYDP
jgi:hypothetical protein